MVIPKNGGFDVAISFCKYLFNDSYPVFLILKKDPKREGRGQYRKTHRGNTVKHTDVLRKPCFQRHLPLYETLKKSSCHQQVL